MEKQDAQARPLPRTTYPENAARRIDPSRLRYKDNTRLVTNEEVDGGGVFIVWDRY